MKDNDIMTTVRRGAIFILAAHLLLARDGIKKRDIDLKYVIDINNNQHEIIDALKEQNEELELAYKIDVDTGSSKNLDNRDIFNNSVFKSGNKFGIKDENNNILLDAKYSKISNVCYSESTSTFYRYIYLDGFVTLVNAKDGTLMQDFMYNWIGPEEYTEDNEVYRVVRIDKKEYLTKDLEIIPRFKNIKSFSDPIYSNYFGTTVRKVYKNGYCGIIDASNLDFDYIVYPDTYNDIELDEYIYNGELCLTGIIKENGSNIICKVNGDILQNVLDEEIMFINDALINIRNRSKVKSNSYRMM